MKIIFLLLGIILIGCSSSPVKDQQAGTPVKTMDSSSASSNPTSAQTTTPAPKEDLQGKSESNGEKQAATGNTSPGTKLTCKLDKDERIIEKFERPSGCELKYTKFGETSVIASSSKGSAHCDAVREKVKSNLETSGFKCE